MGSDYEHWSFGAYHLLNPFAIFLPLLAIVCVVLFIHKPYYECIYLLFLPVSISGDTVIPSRPEEELVLGSFTEQMFSSVASSLTTLNFRCGSRFHNIPLRLFTNLREFKCYCNCSSYQLSFESLSKLTKLVVLECDTDMQQQELGSLSALTKLEHLLVHRGDASLENFHQLKLLTYLYESTFLLFFFHYSVYLSLFSCNFTGRLRILDCLMGRGASFAC